MCVELVLTPNTVGTYDGSKPFIAVIVPHLRQMQIQHWLYGAHYFVFRVCCVQRNEMLFCCAYHECNLLSAVSCFLVIVVFISLLWSVV